MAQPSKREQILETAGNLFINNGFNGVSMDQIAATVPVSKPTLYAHFKDKRELFEAVISGRCESALSALKEGIARHVGLEEGLLLFGHHFIAHLLAPASLQFHRVMMAECVMFPEMAQLFYDSGPKNMHAVLTNFLATAEHEAGIEIEDPSISAEIFISMIKGKKHLKCLLGVNEPEVSMEERDKLVKTVVRIFLNGHRSA